MQTFTSLSTAGKRPSQPLSSRDASRHWPNTPATPISVPGSTARRISNPYGNTEDTLRSRAKHKTFQTQNPVARNTLASSSTHGHVQKKRKTASTQHQNLHRSAPLAPETIEISDDDLNTEDTGVLVPRSHSPNQMVSTSTQPLASTSTNAKPKPNRSIFNQAIKDATGPETTKKHVAYELPAPFPGTMSAKLDKLIKSRKQTEEVHDVDADDEIEQFTDDPPVPSKSLQRPSVKTLTQIFEPEIPRLDLAAERNLNKKAGMKPKLLLNRNRNLDRIPPERTTAVITSSGIHNRSRANGVAKINDKDIKIPLMAAFVQSHGEIYNEASLVFNPREKSLKLELKSASSKSPRWALSDFDAVVFADPQSGQGSGLYVIRFEFRNDRSYLGFKVNARDPDCEIRDYDTLVRALKAEIHQHETTRDTKALWETLQRLHDETLQRRRADSLHAPIETVKKPFMGRARQESSDVEETGPPPPPPEPKAIKKSAWPSKEAKTIAPPTRRSDRQAEAEHNKAAETALARGPIEKADEIVLVYPWGTPGAVNLNRGDLSRLGPSEFLNDNLIEFGLKLWLNQLERDNPELFKSVYVFSSFFYGKLKTKKGEENEGYQQVRRWTSKVDIFSKKYLIVPINENYHWYLAIICNPHHVLDEPPAIESPSTRGRVRAAVTEAPAPENIDGPTQAERPADAESPAETVEREDQVVSPSDEQDAASVEGILHETRLHEVSQELQDMELLDNYTTSRASTPPNRERSSPMVSSPLTPIPEDLEQRFIGEDADVDAGATGSEAVDVDMAGGDDVEMTDLTRSVTPSGEESLDELAWPAPVVHTSKNSKKPRSRRPRPSIVHSSDEDEMIQDAKGKTETGEASNPRAVPPANFYASASSSTAKRKLADVEDGSDIEVGNVERVGDTGSSKMMKQYGAKGKGKALERTLTPVLPSKVTIIFTLDSLGSKHPKVTSTLATYLNMEAEDKLGIKKTTKAIGKTGQSVPSQPNYCDCGLYLIHFVDTFMSDPDHYYTHLLGPTMVDHQVRTKVWKADAISGMRQAMRARAGELSKEWMDWKMQKAEEEEEKRLREDATMVESSDSDVDIVETVIAPAQTQKGKGRGGKGKAKA